MPLIPYKSFCLETRLSPEEVLARLSAATEPVRWVRCIWADHLPFQGEVTADQFRIMRIIGYRNSFMPIIHGRIAPTAAGSRVEGTMEMHPAVAVLMAFWFAGVLLIGVPASILAMARDGWNAMFFIPIGMFVFGWGVTAGGFTLEAHWSMKLLREVVAAEPEVPTESPAA